MTDRLSENPRPSSTNNSDSEPSNKEGERGKDGKLLVRGREFNQRKPETFNQLWTPEEQKRLEELLVVYPPEHTEMERFRKIAKALGNRTPLQVQSRVQKYFIKLQKAGLPVPGRTYNFTQYSNNRKVGLNFFFSQTSSILNSLAFLCTEWPPSSKEQPFSFSFEYFFRFCYTFGVYERFR
jgi:hypothetical protein